MGEVNAFPFFLKLKDMRNNFWDTNKNPITMQVVSNREEEYYLTHLKDDIYNTERE